jgi:hypothetical protein
MVQPNLSDMLRDIQRPIISTKTTNLTPRKTETSEEAALRKGAVLGANDASFAETVASAGIEDIRQHKKPEEELNEDSFSNDPLLRPIARIHMAYKAKKTPQDKPPTPEQISNLIYKQTGIRQIGQNAA